MKDGFTATKSAAKPKTDRARLRRKTPAQIRRALEVYSEAHPTDKTFWEGAKVITPRRKETVTVRRDVDLLARLRRERDYQMYVNAVLRVYMNAKAPIELKPGKPLRN